MPPYEIERAHYRIYYPLPVQPVFVPAPREEGLPVVDCSERGLRFQSDGDPAPTIGARVEGTVRFRTGPEVTIAGTIVRIQDGKVALHLDEPGIPWRVLLQEQLVIRKQFPYSL